MRRVGHGIHSNRCHAATQIIGDNHSRDKQHTGEGYHGTPNFITRRRIIVCRISSSRGARIQKIGGSRLTTYSSGFVLDFITLTHWAKRQRRASVVLPEERWNLEFSYLLLDPTAGIPRTCRSYVTQEGPGVWLTVRFFASQRAWQAKMSLENGTKMDVLCVPSLIKKKIRYVFKPRTFLSYSEERESEALRVRRKPSGCCHDHIVQQQRYHQLFYN